MNFIIRTASVVSLVTFWLATIVWTVLIVAAPANAAPSNENGTGSTSTSAPSDGADKSPRQAHLIPGFKPQPTDGGQAHLIPGFKPQPITTGSSNGPTVKLGSTLTSPTASEGTDGIIRIDQAWGYGG